MAEGFYSGGLTSVGKMLKKHHIEIMEEVVQKTEEKDKTMFDMIEIGKSEIQHIKDKGFDLEIVPVTEDMATEIIPGDERLHRWFKARNNKAWALQKQLDNSILKPLDFVNDGWVTLWMAYYRLQFDFEEGKVNFVNARKRKRIRGNTRKGTEGR